MTDSVTSEVKDETVLTGDTAGDKGTDKVEDKSLLADKGEEKVGDKAGELKDGKDSTADKAEKVIPDVYADFKVPEGMEVDKSLLNEALPVFKEMKLSQEEAQKLVDLQAQYSKADAERVAKAWKTTIDNWVNDAKNDKEFGGTKFNESIVVSKKGINHFGNDKFKEMLEFTGVGNHPEMIRFLYKVGALVKEDDILHGTNRTGDTTDVAKRLFPTMK